MRTISLKLLKSCVLVVFALNGAGRAAPSLPLMPQPATSFGATVTDGWLYTYGGNTGRAHEFHRESVKGDFFRLKVPAGEAWEKLPGGLALLSASLVGDQGRVIRIGGMNARNAKGEKNDLHSTDEVQRYDPATQKWEALAPLPEPRSSHDTALLDGVLYVGGGWNLSGDDGEGTGTKSKWADTVFTFDLRAPGKGWQSQPQPFHRRAIAAVAHGGRIWFMGGIDDHDELSRGVDWYEPSTRKWGKGPDLPAGGMAGFGMAAVAQGGHLYISPFSGVISRLSDDGSKWDDVTKLNPIRFFHHLLPLADGRVVAVGGSNRDGLVKELELISLEAKSDASLPASAPGSTPVKASEAKLPSKAAWPQWRGPQRDGVSAETGWRKDWPAEGLPKLWRASVGVGMSSPVVEQGRLIAHGNDGNGMDSIIALNAATGAELWRYSFPCKSAAHEMPIVPNGPGATPTISEGHVYALSREGDLVNLDAASGQLAWKKNLVTDLGGKRPVYGYSQSPLVSDGRIFLDVGAEPEKPTSTVALDAASGEVKWRAGTGEAGYSSARVFERDGQKLVAMFKGEALDVFDPADGRVAWSYKITGRDFTNALTPVFVGHRILVSNTSEAFARLLDWDAGATPNVRPAWSNQQFALLFNNAILLDGRLFAFNEKRRSPVEFSCVDAESGTTLWTSDTVPIGTFVLSDGHWIFLTREGEVVLAPASATELKPVARFKALEGKCYATPTLVDGRLYVRNNAGDLAAFDVGATPSAAR